jgi:hypothetical protein
MKAIRCPAWRRILSIATALLVHSSLAAAQPVMETIVGFDPQPAPPSAARGVSVRGWDPLTVAGTVDNPQTKAACWIRTSTIWTRHELPGFAAGLESWANAVEHLPVNDGEWTLVVGSAMDAAGALRPVRWEDSPTIPWTLHPLLTLEGGTGEANTLFLPDNTPLPVLIAGWASKIDPITQNNIRTAALWKISATGEFIIPLDYPEGFETNAHIITSPGGGVVYVAGGGEIATGEWRPQLWRSTDDGQTWSNEEVPLPVGATEGEVVDGYSHWPSGQTVPIVWDLDYTERPEIWVIHELPLPSGAEGGQNSFVHKLPGGIRMYGNSVLRSGLPDALGLWFDEPAGWTLYEPADYLLNPEDGIPAGAADADKYGRIAVQFHWPHTSGTPTASAQTGTSAGLLIPSSATAVEDHPPTPRLIAMSASPNPFQSGIRIGYTLPRDARATITIHDVTGRMVSRLNEGPVTASEERTIRWNGQTLEGQRAASGAYIVRVATPHEIATLKIVRVD